MSACAMARSVELTVYTYSESWDRGVWCADVRQHLHSVRRVLMAATTTVTHRVQLLTNPIARSSTDGLYCAIHIIHDVPGAFVVTSCGSDGSDGPHRWRRTDRSVVFARWHQCTGIYMVTQTHAISLPDDVSIGSPFLRGSQQSCCSPNYAGSFLQTAVISAARVCSCALFQ